MASSPGCRRARDVGDAARSLWRLFQRADRPSDPEPRRAGRDRESGEPIPVHFAYRLDINVTEALRSATEPLRDLFDTPDLATIDDAIVDGTVPPGAPPPLAMFRAARVDYSLHRLYHYTGTDPEHFQNFVIFTNYQFYVDAFARICRDAHGGRRPRGEAFVEPGNLITATRASATRPTGRAARAPAADARFPSGATELPRHHHDQHRHRSVERAQHHRSRRRAATACLADARPLCGLRNTQKLGDYVLAHGYVREDHVLDEELPLWVPVPALAEMQVALEQAVGEVTGLTGFELKRVMRTGTVASVDNRNWELGDHAAIIRRLSLSRAIALDMESAAVAANGFRFRVPYGTLLCVSDKPLHGEIKLAGMAGEFYRQRVGQHLEIGLRALEKLKSQERERLHSRKLRSFAEVAFQ